MRHRSLFIVTTAVTVGALTLSACGSRDDNSEGGGGGKKTVVIGLDAPLTGDLSALGQGIKNSADLAVKTANKNNEVEGVTFKLESLDDVAQAATGQQNATKLVGNQDVMGVVGPLNSDVGQAMQKVFANDNLVQVSPANTNPEMTQGKDWQTGKKVRGFDTYFRTATTDAIQGPYAAQFMFNEKKLKNVYVIDDKKTYGAGLAATFSTEFKKLGGKVVGTDHINPDDKDFSSVASKVAQAKADFVYYGGEYPAGAPLASQIKNSRRQDTHRRRRRTLQRRVHQAGQEELRRRLRQLRGRAPGDPGHRQEVHRRLLRRMGYDGAFEAYGGYAYDSTWAIIQAVKAVVEKNDGKLPSDVKDARKQITAAMQDVKFDGVTGTVGFDEYGDTINKQLSLYEVKGGKHVPVKTGVFEG